MGAADVLKRQAELHRARRARDEVRCTRDDCAKAVPAKYATGGWCVDHWQTAQGYDPNAPTLRDDEGNALPRLEPPDPPVRMTHTFEQARSAGSRQWWITGACLLCGSRDVERRDQLGRPRGHASITRQLIGLVDGVPFLVGARCAACSEVVRRHEQDGKVHPVVAAVCEMLQRGHRAARRAGRRRRRRLHRDRDRRRRAGPACGVAEVEMGRAGCRTCLRAAARGCSASACTPCGSSAAMSGGPSAADRPADRATSRP